MALLTTASDRHATILVSRTEFRTTSPHLDYVTMGLYGYLMPGNETEAAGLLDAYLARVAGQAQLAPVSRQLCSNRPDSAGLGRTEFGSDKPKPSLTSHMRAITQIYEGTNEIQRVVIARTLK